ncbi:MAG: transglutaminase domain-containing protein [Polyangiaceae bacterium]
MAASHHRSLAPRLSTFLALASLAVATSVPVTEAHAAPEPKKAGATAKASRLPNVGIKPAKSAGIGWVDTTPDKMVGRLATIATTATTSEAQALAAVGLLDQLSAAASWGTAKAALIRVAKGASHAEVRAEANLLAHDLSEDIASEAWVAASEAAGIVHHVAIVGPFRDTGGGLDRKEGPEPSAFRDEKANHSWGAFEVRQRRIPPSYNGPSGLPLDLFMQPRKETCSYIATRVTLADERKFIVRVASAGQVRVSWDGTDVAKDENVHAGAVLDRVAARIDAPKGEHLLSVKTCSGALNDSGRVRIRTTDLDGAPLALTTSADMAALPATFGKVTFTPTVTALGRTLKDEREGFMNAILRSAADADDLRSPKAGGLFSVALGAGAGATPDDFAIAAFASQASTHRSEWLSEARIKGDARVSAFARDTQITDRAGNGSPDWAYSLLMARTDLGLDDDFTRAYVESQLGDAGRMNAFQRARRAMLRGPQAASLDLLALVTKLSQSLDPNTLSIALTELKRRGRSVFEYATSVAAKQDRHAFGAAVAHAFDGHLTNPLQASTLVRMAISGGPRDAALPLATTLVRMSPNRAENWSLLANAYAYVGGKPDETMAALRRARELEPTDARTRAEMAMRTEQKQASSYDDERHITPAQVFLSRRKGVPAGVPEAADRELHWMRVVTMHDDGRVSQLLHYAREIVIPPRSEQELAEDVPQEGNLSELLFARVHRKEGGIAYPTEERQEGGRPQIQWPTLAAGDTVEVAVRSWTSTAVGGRGDAPFYFSDYAGAITTHPLIHNEVIVEAPSSRPIFVDVVRGGAHKRTEKNEGGRRFLHLVWETPPNIQDEPLAPALSETVPLVVGSTFKNWDDFRKWYAEAVRGFTEPDAEVQRLAKDLTKKARTRDEKLRALFNFVADDIRYVNYVSGEWWLPNRPQQLLARREGDCDDKALLLISLLKAVGVQAEEVLVQTRMTGMPSVLLAPGAAIPMFDHGIAFLPGARGDAGTYLDATSPQSRLGPLPSMDGRAKALRMDGPAEIVTLPATKPDAHGFRTEWKIALQPDGSGTLTADETHRGDSAFFLRTAAREEQARAQYIEESALGGFFSQIHVDKKVDFDGDLPNGNARIRYTGTADAGGFARKDEGELVVLTSGNVPFTSQLAPLTKRTLPVVLPPGMAPSEQTRVFRVTPPAGYDAESLPDGGVEDGGPFGRSEVTYKRDGKTIVVERKTLFDAHVIPVDQYEKYRSWLLRVDALSRRPLRLVRREK